MNERFQTFNTRLRPHRIAVLTDVDDDDWPNTCLAIIEFLSQVWGGYHSVIVPTDGKAIDDIFWAMLSSFDPDVILRYQKSGADLERAKPKDFERIVASHIAQAGGAANIAGGGDSVRKGLRESVLGEFSVSDELCGQLLIRLSPFHFEDYLQIRFFAAGASPDYPLTSVKDIVEFVPSPDAIFAINDNLPPERQAPPPLWLAAELGAVTPIYLNELGSKGITCVPRFMIVESDSEIIKWGIQPGLSLGVNTPFSFTRLALATVRAVAARRYSIPSVIIRGDTLKDFCLYYGLSRLHGRALWLPSWFDSVPDSYPDRMMTAVRKLVEMGRKEHCDHLDVVSTSLSESTLQETVAILRDRMTLSSFSVQDGNSGAFIRKIVEYPSKVYVKKNIDQITTHQIVDERMPGFFESPVPLAFTHVNPLIHRWLVEISFMDRESPRHPALGAHLVSGPNLGEVRAGLDGLAFLCPGALVRGDDIELQMLRVSIAVPGPEKVFRVALTNCGYDFSVSDKGRYETETIRKFAGIEGAAYALRDGQTSRLLKEFLNKKGPTDGVYDEGVLLNDKRRYLNFACILKFLPDRARARETVDGYIANGVFYRGLVLKCNRCSDLAWFSIAEITQSFTCRRCGTSQQYTYPSWHYPDEPSWFYKLDEMIYQMLCHNGDVTILTVDALRRVAKGNFQFAPELSIRPQTALKSTMEIDIPCIANGKMIVGEAKSVNTLATKEMTSLQAAVKYRDLAEQLGAYGVIFSTSTPDWDESTHRALDLAFSLHPHLKVYRYTSTQLWGN